MLASCACGIRELASWCSRSTTTPTTASSPVAASPTTVKPGVAATTAQPARRKGARSSTISTPTSSVMAALSHSGRAIGRVRAPVRAAGPAYVVARGRWDWTGEVEGSRLEGVDRARTHYELLGVAPRASTSEIRAAYRALARRCHPDLAYGLPEGSMAELNEAWAVLGDPRRRAAYDDWLARRRPGGDGPDVVGPPARGASGEPLAADELLDEPLTDGRAVQAFALMVAVAATIAVAALVALFAYAIFFAG